MHMYQSEQTKLRNDLEVKKNMKAYQAHKKRNKTKTLQASMINNQKSLLKIESKGRNKDKVIFSSIGKISF